MNVQGTSYSTTLPRTLSRYPQHSTFDTRHSTLHTRYSTLNTQHSTLNTWHSTVNNPQPSTNNPQPSTLNQQPSTVNPQPTTVNRQPSTLNLQPSPLNPGTRRSSRPRPQLSQACGGEQTLWCSSHVLNQATCARSIQKPFTPNPGPKTLHPKFPTPNPEPWTLSPEPLRQSLLPKP